MIQSTGQQLTPKVPDFCCPGCKGLLDRIENAYRCGRCLKSFPIFYGIPDFRLFVGPYAADEHTYKEDDYRQAGQIIERFLEEDFATLAHQYLVAADVKGPRFARLYHAILTMTERGLADLRALEGRVFSDAQGRFSRVLEVGCGSGSFLAAASGNVGQIVGADMAMRWLILAKKRLSEMNIDSQLVCCYAEYLPFKDDSFDLVIAEDVLEHVQLQAATLREWYRVTEAGGITFMKYPNRFSLTPEPHVKVWGVGFLPRRWMSWYVQRVTGKPYEHVRLLSIFETKRLLRKSGFKKNEVSIPPIPPNELRTFSSLKRAGVAVYDAMRRWSVTRAVFYIVGPFFHVLAYSDKEASQESPAPNSQVSVGVTMLSSL